MKMDAHSGQPADPFKEVWMEEAGEVSQDAYDSLPVPSTQLTPYPSSLAHDVALTESAEDLQSVLQHHCLSTTDYDYISELPSFKRELSEWRNKILTEGYTFKLKLRGMAEGYLPEVHSLLHNPTVAPSVKTDLFKYITRCAGLEPPKEVSSASAGSQQTKILVQWGDGSGQVAVQTTQGSSE